MRSSFQFDLFCCGHFKISSVLQHSHAEFIMIDHLFLPLLLSFPIPCHFVSPLYTSYSGSFFSLLNIFLLIFSDFPNSDFLFQTNLSQTIPSVLSKQLEIISQLLHSLGTTVWEIWIVCLCRHVLFKIFLRSCSQSCSVPLWQMTVLSKKL